MIELQDITKTFQLGKNELQILKGINLKVEKGELLALMGASGSGKSTTMNIVGLLDRPTSGQYLLDGQEVSKLSNDTWAELRNKSIGFVFQTFFLLPRLTALQNVGLPLIYRNIKTSEIKERAMHSLEKVKMADRADHKPSELSGGQQQRVAIARALVGGPQIILADEPTGALDTQTSQGVMELLIHINKEDKATIVIVTHDPHVAEQCARTVYMKDGQLTTEAE